jgi:integrase
VEHGSGHVDRPVGTRSSWRGESVVVVAECLGHDNANLVLSTYGHVMPNNEDRTRKAIDEAWIRQPDGLETAWIES